MFFYFLSQHFILQAFLQLSIFAESQLAFMLSQQAFMLSQQLTLVESATALSSHLLLQLQAVKISTLQNTTSNFFI